MTKTGRIIIWTACALGLILVAGVAGMWPRDDSPSDPDAVVVLGGAGGERAELGIALRDRFDATLVLSSSARVFAENRGVECGVDAICFDPFPENTTGEARGVAEMAALEGWEHVTVATSRFHTTRSRVLFRQCLGDDVSVVGAQRNDEGNRVSARRWLREAAGTLIAGTVRRAC